MRDKKATGYDDVPGDVLKLLGKDDLRILTHLINNTHESGEWPKKFTKDSMTALQNAVTIAHSASSHIQHRQ
jgi:hypothetical protein